PMRPFTVAIEPGDGLDGRLHIGLGLRHPRHIFEDGCPTAARTVAVDLRHAVLVEINAEGIRIPSRAGITPGGMTGPPGAAPRAPQRLSMSPKHACKLEQGGVSRGVVADPDVPTVVMAVHEDELLRFALPFDLDHRQLLRIPALLHGRDNGGAAPPLRTCDQLGAIRLVGSHSRYTLLAPHIAAIRA